MNFCSTEFKMDPVTKQWVPVPLNWELNMHSLCHLEKKKVREVASTLRSLCSLYVYHPKFDELYRLAHKLAYDESQEWVQLREMQSNDEDGRQCIAPMSVEHLRGIITAAESASDDVCEHVITGAISQFVEYVFSSRHVHPWIINQFEY